MTSRWVAAVLCAVLAAVLLAGGAAAIWADRTLFDTDRYVATFGPLSDDPDLHAYVVSNARARLETAVDLPDIPIIDTTVIEDRIIETGTSQVRQFVESDAFGAVWRDGIRRSHERFMGLTDDPEARGRIGFSLVPVAERIEALSIAPQQFRDTISENLRQQDEIVLFRSRALATLQRNLNLLRIAEWGLPLLSALLLIATVLLAPVRLAGALMAGISVALSALIAYVGVLVLRDWIVGLTGIPDELSLAVYRLGTADLLPALAGLALAGGLIALISGAFWFWRSRKVAA